jgi:hypothetical protein
MAEREEKKRILPQWTIPVLTILVLMLMLIYMAVTKQVAVDAALKECNDYYHEQFGDRGRTFNLPTNLTMNLTLGGTTT